MTCNCPNPVLCQRLGRHMNAYLLSIWEGTNPSVPPEKAAALRTRWAAAAGVAPPVPQKCPHLWRRARDAEGKVKTRLCKAG